jgi:23S rRNA pseudouridine1911/1915/1917 synthase
VIDARLSVPQTETNHAVREGEVYSYHPQPLAPRVIRGNASVTVPIVYEDEYLWVINKPAAMTVHPGAGTGDDTLVHGLLACPSHEWGEVSSDERPGIVHRLDRDTTGLLVVAKQERVLSQLSRAVAERRVKRSYVALVYGVPSPSDGQWTWPIARSSRDRTRMQATRRGGREALTYYRVADWTADHRIALLDLRLETGRTHQIRVHASHAGHGVIGDPVYGADQRSKQGGWSSMVRHAFGSVHRQLLHASRLELEHPVTGVWHHWKAPWPEDFATFAAALGFQEK